MVADRGDEIFADEHDSAELAALVNDAYRGTGRVQGWTSEAHLLGGQRIDADMVADLLCAQDSYIVVRRDAAGLAACLHVRRVSTTQVDLGLFAVRPDCQGRGVGGRLLAAAEAWAHSVLGACRAEITVIGLREDLVAWYRRRGYCFTGMRRPFPYGDARFGHPRRPDLALDVMSKAL